MSTPALAWRRAHPRPRGIPPVWSILGAKARGGVAAAVSGPSVPARWRRRLCTGKLTSVRGWRVEVDGGLLSRP